MLLSLRIKSRCNTCWIEEGKHSLNFYKNKFIICNMTSNEMHHLMCIQGNSGKYEYFATCLSFSLPFLFLLLLPISIIYFRIPNIAHTIPRESFQGTISESLNLKLIEYKVSYSNKSVSAKRQIYFPSKIKQAHQLHYVISLKIKAFKRLIE